MKIEKIDNCANRKYKMLWKVVRKDSYADVSGEIIYAYETSGECCLWVDGKAKTLNLGPGGILIIKRGR
jgi:hypothetical protein